MNAYRQRKFFPTIVPGQLVEVIEAADQGYFTKALVGKVGIVIKNTRAKSSDNIWEVFIEEKIFNLHALDLKVIE